MSVHYTTRCGNCNKSFQFFEPGAKSWVGAPIVKCSACNTLNKTEQNLYRDLGLVDKLFFWVGQYLRRGIFIIVPIILTIGTIYKGEFDYSVLFVVSLMSIGGWFEIQNLKALNPYINFLEKTHDKNNGFIWDYELYGDEVKGSNNQNYGVIEKIKSLFRSK